MEFSSVLFYILRVILCFLLTCVVVHAEETLSEGHVERVDRLCLPATLLQISDSFSSTGPAAATLLVVTFHPIQPLKISHYVDRVFRQQSFLGEILRLRRLSVHTKQLGFMKLLYQEVRRIRQTKTPIIL